VVSKKIREEGGGGLLLLLSFSYDLLIFFVVVGVLMEQFVNNEWTTKKYSKIS